ncbi:MAG: glycoside hydrolase family 28 protein [Candidatus Sumerlaeota bacterium]
MSEKGINIRESGAVGDGKTVCTDIINAALREASESGIGRVVVPPGVFVCGTIQLQSNITLEITTGATLLASPNFEDFSEIPLEEAESRHHDHSGRCFILANKCENVTICGGGIIDGNNEVYANPPREKRGPNHQWFGYRKESYQPTVELRKTNNIRLLDITIQNGVRWNVHLFRCERVWVERVCILNDPYAGNSDGFDIDGCRDVFISNTKIDTGDDAIVLKTLVDSQSCERITVTNCVLKSTCAAFKIGTESWHDFRHITFSDSVVHQSSRAFEIVVFDGGNVEDVTVSGLVVDTNIGVTMTRPLHIDCAKRRAGYNPLPERTEYALGRVRRVSFSDITISTDGRILLTAADGTCLDQISLRNIQVHMPWIEDPRAVDKLSDGMQSSNGSPEARLARAAIVAKDIKNLLIDGFSISYPERPVGEDYMPKIEKREVVRDPREEFEPMPDFNVFYGRNIEGGYVNLKGARPSGKDVAVLDVEDCDVTIECDGKN